MSDEAISACLDRLASAQERPACLAALASGELTRTQGIALLSTLMEQGRHETFDQVCAAVGRSWSLTPKDFNIAVAGHALGGDVRWLGSLLQHRLTQVDHAVGTSASSQGSRAWLPLLVDMSRTVDGGWDHLLGVLEKLPHGMSGSFGRIIMSADTPEPVRKALRKVEEKERSLREWRVSAGGGSLPHAWHRHETPFTGWIRKIVDAVLDDEEKAKNALLAGHIELEAMIAAGADPMAWHGGMPAVVELGMLEGNLRRLHPQLVPLSTALFDVLLPLLDMRVRGGSLMGSWWQNDRFDIPTALAGFGGVEMARHAIVAGADPNHRDRRGCGWEWHAWDAGVVDGVQCPRDQVHIRNATGQSLLAAYIEALPLCNTPIEAAIAIGKMLDAGLSMNDTINGIPLRQWMDAQGGVASAVLSLLDARQLQQATPVSAARPSPRRV